MAGGVPVLRSLLVATVLLASAPAAAAVLTDHPAHHRPASTHGHKRHRPHAHQRAGLLATVPPGPTLLSISCANARTCIATGVKERRLGPLPFFVKVGHPDEADGRGRVGNPRSPATPPRAEESGSLGPGPVAGEATGPVYALFTSVSCPTHTFCIAVGSHFRGSGNPAPLAEAWTGDRWHLLATRAPRTRRDLGSTLSSVSCRSPRACIAVGYHQARSGVGTLAEAWNGTRWRILRSSQNMPGARVSLLTAVSCSAPSACTAVGDFAGRSGSGALAERWNGSAWRIQPAAGRVIPSGSALSGVSCPTARSCIAVGGAQGGASGVTLAEIWNGATWRLLPSPNPSNTVASTLDSVSCRSAGRCMAVGFDRLAPGGYATLIERWNGTSWRILMSPGHFRIAELYGVSCPAARTCVAAGGFARRSGGRAPLVEEWNGKGWRIRPVPRA